MQQFAPQSSPQFDRISFYVVAHADDWQLFMQPNVYADIISPNCKVVFIITTAGDAGLGELFWKAREEGSKSSIRYCIAPRFVTTESWGNREFNDHLIYSWSLNNTTTYFLRLPDGNIDGGGLELNNFQSLLRCKTGQIESISTLDQSATYRNWQDIINTIESITRIESRGITDQWIHYLNPDVMANPDDHADHGATGHAIQSFDSIRHFHQVLYLGYSSCTSAENLTFNELFWKAGLFAVYEKAVFDICGYSTLKENPGLYLQWCCTKPGVLEVSASS